MSLPEAYETDADLPDKIYSVMTKCDKCDKAEHYIEEYNDGTKIQHCLNELEPPDDEATYEELHPHEYANELEYDQREAEQEAKAHEETEREDY